MKKLTVLFVLLLSVLASRAQTDVERLATFVRNINTFNRYFPQEKVYLHFDNTAYFKGEDIWYAAYVLRADSNRATDLSRVLYVDLLDPSGEIVETSKVCIDSGRASGCLHTKDILQAGFYEVRAYTRYMTNWDGVGIFSHVFPIFDEPQKAGDYSNLSIPEPVDRHKLPSYRTETTVDEEEADGVKAWKPTGSVTTAVKPTGDGFSVVMQASDSLSGRTLGMAVLHQGHVILFDTLTAVQPAFEVDLGRTSLGDGINDLVIIDPSGNVLADQMLFKYPSRGVADSISVTMEGATINPFQLVKMRLKGRPNTTFSLSVRDYATEVNGSVGNAATWMYLGSELKDYLPAPESYLAADDAARRGAVASLLAQQPWHRYPLPQMLGREKFYKRQPLEDRLLLYGQLHQKKKKLTVGNVDLRATLYNASGNVLRGEAVTDDNGYYAFQLPDCSGDWTLLLNTQKDDKAAQYYVGIDRHFAPRPQPLSNLQTQPVPVPELRMRMNIDTSYVEPDLMMDEKNHVLGTVTVKGKGLFDRAREGWESENRGKYYASIYYNVDEASDRIADSGQQQPDFFDWLADRNPSFRGKRIDMYKDLPQTRAEAYSSGYTSLKAFRDDQTPMGERAATVGSENTSLDGAQTMLSNDANDITVNVMSDHILLLQGEGLSYKNRPIVWVLNNSFYYISNSPYSIKMEDLDLRTTTSEIMPEDIEDFKSVYISEDPKAWRRYVSCDKLDGHDPVTIFVYTRHRLPVAQKGVRHTHFQGYDQPAVFQTNDYSIMPKEPDYRRTLYWNPEVTTDADGNAEVSFWNNSSCRQIVISAEGIGEDGRVSIY